MSPCPHCGLDSHTGENCPRLIFVEGERRILDRRRTARTAPDRAAIDAAFKALRDELRRGDLEQRALIERQRETIEKLAAALVRTEEDLERSREVTAFYRELLDDIVDGHASRLRSPARELVH